MFFLSKHENNAIIGL